MRVGSDAGKRRKNMKCFVVVWLLLAGIGVSYSIVAERQRKVRLLKEMGHSLNRLAYYMYQWRMPVKEAIAHVAKEEKGILCEFYKKLGDTLAERQVEDFGILWQEQSNSLWKEQSSELVLGKAHRGSVTGINSGYKEIWAAWSDTFINLPMEAEALKRMLLLRAEEIEARSVEIEQKYKGEQKLVFTMGFFVSAFFCLIFW